MALGSPEIILMCPTSLPGSRMQAPSSSWRLRLRSSPNKGPRGPPAPAAATRGKAKAGAEASATQGGAAIDHCLAALYASNGIDAARVLRPPWYG